MEKKYLIYALLVSILLQGCKKATDTTAAYPYHLNVSINKVNFTTNSVARFGLSNEAGCVANKSFEVTNAGQIDVDAYFLDCYFKHFTNNIDFKNTKTGSYKIFDGGDLLKANQCNGDLIIGLTDNSINNLYSTAILQPTNIVHKITNISIVDTTAATTITYSVSGNFSCNFKNANNVIIPITGDYVLPIKIIK
ncbi:hypothetical protein ACFOW1_10680 [Parasediminibacterium paludis]|uniref:Lipoprotein n=1 Tax=Parasediminibacterium paludis TaxID=908966 RepID=A0ABV8PYZ8_9BACT